VSRSTDNAFIPDYSSSRELLNDGQPVTIRLMSGRDAPAEREFISGLSPETRRLRFLGQIGQPSDAMITWLTAIDFVHDLAFVAVITEGERERIVGVSRYGLDPAGGRCECAVVVADDWQGRGLGVRLMQHLIDVARARGIEVMYSLDAASNTAMKDLARFLGFSRRPDPEDATMVIHELRLTP
jgi:GNAT superfamily N-acetyltransferase